MARWRSDGVIYSLAFLSALRIAAYGTTKVVPGRKTARSDPKDRARFFDRA
jgi:hypothetical protein